MAGHYTNGAPGDNLRIRNVDHASTSHRAMVAWHGPILLSGHKQASSATLTLYNMAGERLYTVRMGRIPESRKLTLHSQLLDQLVAMLDHYASARLSAVADPCRWARPEVAYRGLGRPAYPNSGVRRNGRRQSSHASSYQGRGNVVLSGRTAVTVQEFARHN